MPVVMTKARARITVVVMAINPFQQGRHCQNGARTSVTAITFWRFSGAKAQQEALLNDRDHAGITA
jgi:hypothetical protein